MPEITTERVMAPVDRILVDGRHVCATDISYADHLECPFLRTLNDCMAGESPVHVVWMPGHTIKPHAGCPIAPGVTA